jgi:hypothetical protein
VLNCGDVIAQLAGFLDEQLPAELRREIEHHLAECRTCTAIYDSTRKTIRITTESRTFEIPEGASGRLIARIMARVREES